MPTAAECVAGKLQGSQAEVLIERFVLVQRRTDVTPQQQQNNPRIGLASGWWWVWSEVLTMLPAWSRNVIPLVFIILRYGLLNVLLEKPVVCSQGSDMSLNTTCISPSD